MAYYKGDGKKEVNVLEGSVKLREPDLTIKPQKTFFDPYGRNRPILGHAVPHHHHRPRAAF